MGSRLSVFVGEGCQSIGDYRGVVYTMHICAVVVWVGLLLTSLAQAGVTSAGQETKSVNGEDAGSNEVKEDSYSMYRKLMNMRRDLTQKQAKEDSEGLKMVKSAIKVILETTIHSFINGFLPTVERVRRDAGEEERTYLDGAVYLAGALLGKHRCSQMIACRAGKFVQNRMPGAQLAVMMAESMVPNAMLDWFGVVKTAVIDRSDNCEADYRCSLSEDEEQQETENS